MCKIFSLVTSKKTCPELLSHNSENHELCMCYKVMNGKSNIRFAPHKLINIVSITKIEIVALTFMSLNFWSIYSFIH